MALGAGGIGKFGKIGKIFKKETFVAPSKDSAKNVASYEKLKKDLKIKENKKPVKIKELENGNRRYYDDVTPASKPGEMVGSRGVTEYNPNTGDTRYWRETIDSSGRVRRVRPQNGKDKVHYDFDTNGNYLGSDK